jgi:hypothetical protein
MKSIAVFAEQQRIVAASCATAASCSTARNFARRRRSALVVFFVLRAICASKRR